MQGRIKARTAIALALAAAAVVAPQTASAAIDDVFGGQVECTEQGDGVRFCGTDPSAVPAQRSTVPTFDGVPIDVNVAFPPEPSGNITRLRSAASAIDIPPP